MSRSPRLQRFLFEPARFKNDPAVMGMCAEARGLYAILFCSAWEMPEPGVLPGDSSLLAALSYASAEQWARHAPAIAKAFDTETRPGMWVSRGLVDTHRVQSRASVVRRSAGTKGAESKWHNGLDGRAMAQPFQRAIAEPSVALHIGSGVGVGVGESTSESKSKSLPSPEAREREPRGFLAFYLAYPRRNGRRAAAKAFASALRRHPTYSADHLAQGATLFSKHCQEENQDPRYIPLPATWLNQDRFREFFDEEDDHADTQS